MVQTPDAASIVSASLIRTGATTHFFDESARRVPMRFTAGSGSMTVQAPASGTIAPPGYYMLFIVNSAGVPSIAPMVQLPIAGQLIPTPTPTVGAGTPTATPSPTNTRTATATPLPSGSIIVGSNTVQSGLDSDSAGNAEAFQYTAAGSGTVAQLFAYIDSGSAANKISAGLYTDSAGKPGTLLTQGSLANPIVGWNGMGVPQATVSAGQTYWLALLSPVGCWKRELPRHCLWWWRYSDQCREQSH